MRCALYLPLFDEFADPAAIAELATEAEQAGWDGMFVWDHLAYLPPVRQVADPWITLAVMAAGTRRLRLGPMVTPVPRRRPAVLARQTATLDRLSGGRLTFGVGIGGDWAHELSGTGEPVDDRVRGAMLDEALEVLQAAWTGEPVQHEGDHYVFDGLRFLPQPVQRPRIPIWIGVNYGHRRPLRRAARFDGVFPVDVDHPEQLAEIVQTIRSLRIEAGHPDLAADLSADGYDVAIGGPPGTDPTPFAGVGATWWMVTIDWRQTSLDRLRGVILDGPPARS